MGGKSGPAPVDYEGAAIAEGEAAKEVTAAQTWANRPIQENPWGNVNWEAEVVTDPGTGKPVTQWKQITQLADPMNEALWAQMNLQNMRSQLGAGMMGALQGQYFTEGEDGQLYYNSPNWAGAGGMMMPGEPINVSMVNTPDRWGHLQWDIPQYQTEGAVRQLDFGNLPGISDPLANMQNLSGVQDTTGMYGDLSQVNDPQWTVQRAEQAFYDRQFGRLNQQQQSERQQLEIKMRNQGLAPGDEAWDSQVQSMNQKHNDAIQNAQNEAIMAGGREAERMFGMEMGRRQQGASEIGQRFGEQMGRRGQGWDELQGVIGMQQGIRGQYGQELLDLGNFANAAAQQDFMQQMQAGAQGFQDTRQAAEFQNQARQQAMAERLGLAGYNTQQAYQYADYYNKLRQQQLNEYLTQRGFTLNEIQALLNNQQVGLPQFNQFTAASKADTAPILQGAYMQGQQNAAIASQENAFMNNLLGGASSIAGIAGMFSDRRLKSNIRKVGERNGVNWYSYEIFGRPQIGVMADEVPWAAVQHPSGYMMVDYSKV